MEVKKATIKSIALIAMILWALPMVALPVYGLCGGPGQPACTGQQGEIAGLGSQGITSAEVKLLQASSVSDCGSKEEMVDGKNQWLTPSNCLFLEEPIGGKPGHDLYVVDCADGKCKYKIYTGGVVPPNARGPLQAVLTRQAGKEYQGPFGLLYSYLTLIYNYMSGMIIGIAVLFVVVGGIQIATSGGATTGREAGTKRIKQAITGIILWFTASLILYTINPTFFGF